MSDPQEIQHLLTRMALHDLLTTYCRGADRSDEVLLGSVFHEDAVIDVGVYAGPASAFVTMITDYMREAYETTFHAVTNEWMQIDGNRAQGESYIIAFTRKRGGTGEEKLEGGRYLDEFERRSGAWKLTSRRYLQAWSVSPAAE